MLGGDYCRAVCCAIALSAVTVLAVSEVATAAYPADPLADGNPAFCAPEKPVQDFGLLELPPVKEPPESGKELGRGAVDIYGGWSRVMSRPEGFGYGFSEHNYSGTVLLNWTVTVQLWTIDKTGTTFRQVDQDELRIGRLSAAHQPNIELQPASSRRGFYRFDMQIADRNGEVLGPTAPTSRSSDPSGRSSLGLPARRYDQGRES